jgi:hypothetical protein
MTALDLSSAEGEETSLDERLALAEKMIARLQHRFAESAQTKIDRLTEICLTRWVKPARRSAAIRQLRRIAHDLKGEGGSFGFDLITDIAECFGVYLREVAEPQQRHADIVRFVCAFHHVWGERLEGDGGAIGRGLLASLMVLNDRAREAA